MAAMELMATILERSGEETAKIMDDVIGRLTKERDGARAALRLVQERIDDALSGRYMPTADEIRRLTFVSLADMEWAVEHYRDR